MIYEEKVNIFRREISLFLFFKFSHSKAKNLEQKSFLFMLIYMIEFLMSIE